MNPYGNMDPLVGPSTPGGMPPSAGGDVKARLQIPAIGFMVTGALILLMGMSNLIGSSGSDAQIRQALDQALNSNPNLDPAVREFIDKLVGSGFLAANKLLSLLFSAIWGGMLAFGGYSMLNLQRWGVAMAASIMAVIPCCNGCYCLSIPLGIWALVLLNKPEIKAAFR